MEASAKMNQLIKQREELEAEIKALNEVLESQKSVGIEGPLVDSEGFPRADIDVYTVRHARHEINCKQNDHVELMSEIEEELYKIHAEARAKKEESGETESPAVRKVDTRLAFATVNNVDSGSPGEKAGLKVGDSVISFGSITSENFQGLPNLATVLQHSKGKALPLEVRREDNVVRLSLVPQTWTGQGLLGCKLVPVQR